jgi:PAS domain S-box-containing protein
MADQHHGNQPPSMPMEEPPTTLEAVSAAWHQATDALHDSERRYRELVEYSLGLICTHDLTGTILSINPAAAMSLGYRPEDGIGHNLREFLSRDTRHLFDIYLQRIREEGRDTGLMRVVSRTGSERVWMYRNVLSVADGTAYVLGHAIDITDRIAAEQTLRNSEQELRQARAELEARVKARTIELESANQRLMVEIAQREKAERLREQALIEQRDTLAFLTRLTDRLSPVVAFDDLIDVVRQLPVPFLADWTILHLFGDDGSVRVVPGVHADSAQQTKLAALVGSTSAPDPSSPLGQVVASGRLSVVGNLTLPAPDELAGSPYAVGLELLRAKAAAMLPLVVEGRTRAVVSLLSATPQRFSSASLILNDVTRRVALASNRIQLYREAQEANRLKDEFLGMLSHELRTPLNAIFGWARILRTRALDERTAHAVEVIERNAQAQVGLIEEVLDVSRIIRGKMTLTLAPVDVGSVVSATIETIRPTLQAKRLRLDAAIDRAPLVTGDQDRLQQVFWNLLSNAVKFTPAGGTIAVTVHRSGNCVACEIADTGVGIQPEVLPFVFDRFRQADSSTTRTFGGLGLGLAIVKHIVELHGGTVRAASAGEGHGATFSVRLPAGDEVATVSAVDSSAALPASPLQTRTVLVVEDHDDARELIVGVSEGAGATVLSAATVPEAVALAAHRRPDVLVADLGLPGEDGFALLAKVRSMHPGVLAIALTAYARAADRERVLRAGFQHHAVKPVDPQALVKIIANLF